MASLMIQPFSAVTASIFKYDTFDEAVLGAHAAMERGYQMGPNFSVVLGGGSILNAVSDESMKKATPNRGDRIQVTEEDSVILVQFGASQLPPLTYRNDESRDDALETAIKTLKMVYVFEEGHDHLYLMLGSGSMLIPMSGAAYLKNRQEALAMHQKMLAQQAPRTERVQDPRIILPFGAGKR